MTKKRIGTLSIGVLVLIALPAVSVAAPPAAKQWSVDKTDQIKNETEYALYNGDRKLGFDNRTFGVDLGWVNGGFFFFVRKKPDGRRYRDIGLIPEDDNVAIFNTKRNGYLKYYQRGDSKAELEWSDRTPAYEWQIHDQSASGGRVRFALYNSRVKKYLVYQFKNYGINLGWLTAPSSQPQSFSLAMRAQQITNGWVPYLGTFGQNVNGNLISVQNASQQATLMFVKPSQSTNNCSDPNATLRVAPRGMMTPDQMKILYRSSTPRLPISFLACLTTPTTTMQSTQSISITFLNITYKLDP